MSKSVEIIQYLMIFLFIFSFILITIKCEIPPIPPNPPIPQLRNYEIIDSIALKHNNVVKRSVNSVDNQLSEHLVSFRAINKDFNLLLTHNKDIISSQFKAFTVDSRGHRKPIFVDINEFYSGSVDGIDGSDVRAHIAPNGLMTASIQTPDETYEVEPLWRHLDETKRNYNSMILYKHSDVIHSDNSSANPSTNLSKHFCDFIKIDDNITAEETDGYEGYRQKRQTFHEISISDEINREFKPYGTHCAISLTADYLFYETMGKSDEKTTINYLIHIIDRVNKIFNNTEWTDDNSPGFKGMGFFIKEIEVHTEPTEDREHYNSNLSNRPVRDLLENFSRMPDHRQFCLSHLFTHRTFDGSVLGLAYVASHRPGSVGGICSPKYYSHKAEAMLYLNTGLTTTRNSYGNSIITREAVLVTAHELGHNWGSEHDPHTDECSPSADKGGSYVMYTYAVSGYDDNNKFFSPCSKRAIRAVLIQKSNQCFSKIPFLSDTAPDKAYCGNSKVEEDEDCDEGILVKGDEYKLGLCCDSRCKLLPGAYCSDQNSECCNACKIRPLGLVCKHRDGLNCKQESVCNGVSDKCPEPSALPDGNTCLDKGQCRNGKCISYCAALGMNSCLCEEEKNACYRCCRSNTTQSRCAPVMPRDPLSDGTPCRYGHCENQRCEKKVQDFVERFWDVIEEIDINTFVIFMKDNIVGVVVVITLIVWIPISCAINLYDKQTKEEIRRRSASYASDVSQRKATLRSFSNRLSRPSFRERDERQHIRTGYHY